MHLFYLSESESWNEALPVGNGFLGGMVFGGIATEKIALNEDSLWSGERKNRHNPDALKHLPKIRELLFEGRISEAEKLAGLAMFSPNPNPAHYEPLGDLGIYFNHDDNAKVENYKRKLDLETAIASVSYEIDGVNYKREIFTTAVDHVMVIHLTADKPGSISFSLGFDRDRNLDNVKVQDGKIVATGKSLGENGVSFAVMYNFVQTGGEVTTVGATLSCLNADSATVFVTARTSVRTPDFENWCEVTIDAAKKKDYAQLREDHISDYGQFYHRVKIDFGSNDVQENMPTDERLEAVKNGAKDNGLLALYFQFGRYLLISSSRRGSFPANLQGIWNKDMLPIWGSKYTININAQMNYWLAENCNLSELHFPLFDLIELVRKTGTKTAREMYNCRGFTAHHNTDIFGDSAPVDHWMPSTIWPMSGAWLCTHLWEHYLYTLDQEFLSKYYELIKEACLFFVDYLTCDREGQLVTSPSLSPENTYILPNGESGLLCYGPSMDSQIIYQLFSIFIECSELFGRDAEFAEQLEAMIQKLPPIQVGKYGQIMEWSEDYEEEEPGHRHISHLYALYPSNQISVHQTPELAKAARVTLDRRLASGGGHTGWSRAWIINFWARLLDGEKVYENLIALLTHSTLPNLFDDHPPFQIDGNFGGAAGIAEMLLQSHDKELHLLPALPAEIPSGSISGLCARGGFEVDLIWEEGNLQEATIFSKAGNPCTIRVGEKIIFFETETGESYKFELSKSYKYKAKSPQKPHKHRLF